MLNGGNPFETAASNPQYYLNNDLTAGVGWIDAEWTALRWFFLWIAKVNPGDTNHIKLAIADAGDRILDSNVFLKAGSFVQSAAGYRW